MIIEVSYSQLKTCFQIGRFLLAARLSWSECAVRYEPPLHSLLWNPMVQSHPKTFFIAQNHVLFFFLLPKRAFTHPWSTGRRKIHKVKSYGNIRAKKNERIRIYRRMLCL